MVICVDNHEHNYWRKNEFPYYKANRKKDRDKSKLDWKLIFDTLHSICFDLKEFFPYQVLNVPYTEADDIIGVIAKKYHTAERILILSKDKDFLQLHRFPNIEQFSPIRSEWVKTDNPIKEKKLHIMCGDGGDGIPNFLSPDDCLVKEIRQKSLSKKKLELWCEMEPERFCTYDMMRGYRRNETLIDLDKIPVDIQKSILKEFDSPFKEDRSKMFDYFVKHRMKLLIEHIGEF